MARQNANNRSYVEKTGYSGHRGGTTTPPKSMVEKSVRVSRDAKSGQFVTTSTPKGKGDKS